MNPQIRPLDSEQHRLFVICIPLKTRSHLLFQYIQNIQQSKYNHIYHLPQTYKKLDDISAKLVSEYWTLFRYITIIFEDPSSSYFMYSIYMLNRMKPYYYAEQKVVFWNITKNQFLSEGEKEMGGTGLEPVTFCV